MGRLLEIHGEAGGSSSAPVATGDAGQKIERPDGYEPPVLDSV